MHYSLAPQEDAVLQEVAGHKRTQRCWCQKRDVWVRLIILGFARACPRKSGGVTLHHSLKPPLSSKRAATPRNQRELSPEVRGRRGERKPSQPLPRRLLEVVREPPHLNQVRPRPFVVQNLAKSQGRLRGEALAHVGQWPFQLFPVAKDNPHLSVSFDEKLCKELFVHGRRLIQTTATGHSLTIETVRNSGQNQNVPLSLWKSGIVEKASITYDSHGLLANCRNRRGALSRRVTVE